MRRKIVFLLLLAHSAISGQTPPSSPPTTTALQRQIDSLRRIVDSLRGEARPVQSINGRDSAPGGSPFGLRMGSDLKALRGQMRVDSVKGQPGLYETTKVPKPHPSFESYTLVVAPKQGLCKVVGIGVDVSTSIYGSEVKSAFKQVEEQLQERYGTPKSYDFLRSGSIWNEPRDWMMGLLKKERTLVSFWSNETMSSLPATLAAISLEAEALGTEKGFLRLAFEFKNVKDCMAELKKNPF